MSGSQRMKMDRYKVHLTPKVSSRNTTSHDLTSFSMSQNPKRVTTSNLEKAAHAAKRSAMIKSLLLQDKAARAARRSYITAQAPSVITLRYEIFQF